MAQKSRTQLIADINANITTNGNREITGLRLRTILLDMLDSAPNFIEDDIDGTRILVVPGDFVGSNYTNAALIDLVAETDFALFSNDGAGTKIKYTDGYTFFDTLGRITTTPGNYYIVIFKP